MSRLHILLLLISAACISGCNSGNSKNESAPKEVEITTNFGTIVIQLYDETPLHRDNFLKHVENQFYDSISFHRVIESFMIQAGDPRTKPSANEDSLLFEGLDYTVPAEFHPDLFHKKGVLAAARNSNRARASSATQFYIVHGKVYSDSLLAVQEGRINEWLAMNRVENDPVNDDLYKRRSTLRQEQSDSDSIGLITDTFNELVKTDLQNNEKYTYPEMHREVYQTIGGAAHLDQNYTVFGEVINGMHVVDSIASTVTDDSNRPVKDVLILKIRLK